MAFFTLKTKTANLTGDDALEQGTTNIIVFLVEDANGPIQIPTSEWSVRAEFRDKNVWDGGVTTNCPQPTMSILNSGLGGEIQMEIAVSASQTVTPSSNPRLNGAFDIELVHTSGKVTRPYRGDWAFNKEVTGA